MIHTKTFCVKLFCVKKFYSKKEIDNYNKKIVIFTLEMQSFSISAVFPPTFLEVNVVHSCQILLIYKKKIVRERVIHG